MVTPSTPKHDPLAALRQRGFLLYAIARFCSGIGQGAVQATLAYHIYQLAGTPLALGYLGLARVIPQLGMALYGGAFADTHNRKRIVLVAQCVPMTCSAIFAIATIGHVISVPLILGLVVLLGFAGAFDGPARQALLPSLVTPETFQNAITVNSTLQSFSQVCGPALAGLLLKIGDPPAAYIGSVLMMVISYGLILSLRPRAVVLPSRAISWETIREGVAYVRHRQPLLGSMTLDMFAVVFGGAQALLPVYAADILHVGKGGYGILAAALPAGALVMSVLLVLLPRVQQLGRTMMVSVAIYGVATIAFGASRSFPLSIALYALVGMADSVSMVMRQTTLQLGTPDHLRGRVTAVNQIFVGTSNQIGAMESGLLAALTSATFAVVSGGFACLAVLGIVGATMPGLRRYTIHDVLDRRAEDTDDRDAPSTPASTGITGS